MRNSHPNTGESPKTALKAAADVRIVVVDDEEIALDLVELFIRDWSKEATVLRYQARPAKRRRCLVGGHLPGPQIFFAAFSSLPLLDLRYWHRCCGKNSHVLCRVLV